MARFALSLRLRFCCFDLSLRKDVNAFSRRSIGIGLVVMALLSTSSTAYFGLAVLGLVYLANWVRRAAFSSPFGQRGLLWELLIGLGGIAALLFVLIASADLFDPLLNVIDEIIFNKPLASSFYERSHSNTIAWETVASTWGLGVGFGSTRTSNWFAAIVSNAGLIGAAFMALFLVQTFATRPIWRTALSSELLAGLKLSLLPALRCWVLMHRVRILDCGWELCSARSLAWRHSDREAGRSHRTRAEAVADRITSGDLKLVIGRSVPSTAARTAEPISPRNDFHSEISSHYPRCKTRDHIKKLALVP